MGKYILFVFTLILVIKMQAQTGKILPFQKWAHTPPMGWNSWDCYGPSITEDQVKANADYIHSKGLKIGIHIMRGAPIIAVNQKLSVKRSSKTAADIYSTELQCEWLRDNYTILGDREGAQVYYNSILELYASWGVNFIKVDDLARPYHQGEMEILRNAIN